MSKVFQELNIIFQIFRINSFNFTGYDDNITVGLKKIEI